MPELLLDVPVDVDRRPRCRDSMSATRLATRVCATQPIRPRSKRSSPSCAPPVTERTAGACVL